VMAIDTACQLQGPLWRLIHLHWAMGGLDSLDTAGAMQDVLTYAESALFWDALDGSMGSVPLLPGDNVTGVSHSLCDERLLVLLLLCPSSLPSSQNWVNVRSYTALPCRYFTHPGTLTLRSIPLYIPSLSIATPIAVITSITIPSIHPNTPSPSVDTTHSPSTPSIYTHPHQHPPFQFHLSINRAFI
jgi:hypothetical protein